MQLLHMGEEQGMPHDVEVFAFGEPLVGIYPPRGMSIADDVPLSKTWGGDTSNFVLAMSKLGHRAAYLSKVGDDVFGHGFLNLWRASGVDVAGVVVDKTHPTGVYFASYSQSGHEFVYYRRGSAAGSMTPDDIRLEDLSLAKAMHISGISQGIGSNGVDTSLALMKFAKKNGIMVSYDVNYRPLLWSQGAAREIATLSIAEYVDILELTSDEMKLMGWGESPEDIVHHLPRIPRIIAVKMGAGGCCVLGEGKKITVPGFAIDIADTVGAGDAFDAALVSGVLEGMGLEELGTFANAVGALTCRGIGPLRTQPQREEAEALISRLRRAEHITQQM